MSAKEHRRYTPQHKLRIVLEGLQSDEQIARVCRRYGISPTQYYTWKKQLVNSADVIFKRKNNGYEAEIEILKARLSHKDAVIAELTAENLELKKTL